MNKREDSLRCMTLYHIFVFHVLLRVSIKKNSFFLLHFGCCIAYNVIAGDYTHTTSALLHIRLNYGTIAFLFNISFQRIANQSLCLSHSHTHTDKLYRAHTYTNTEKKFFFLNFQCIL